MYYMTMYVSKCEDDVSDAVIMKSAWQGLHNDGILPTTDDRERLRRLIIRLAYLRQSSMQFSGAQVAAMLLGIGKEGTHYTNWSFSKVNLYGFVNYFNASDTGRSRVTLSHEDLNDGNDSDDGTRFEDAEDQELYDGIEDGDDRGMCSR